MKEEEIKKGDAVSWKASEGTIKGKVVKKIKGSETVSVGQNKKRQVKGSQKETKVLVKSNKSGKQAVHKPESLKKN